MIVVRTFGDSLHSDTVEFRNFQRMVTGWKVGGFLLGNRLDGTAVQPAGAANTARVPESDAVAGRRSPMGGC